MTAFGEKTSTDVFADPVSAVLNSRAVIRKPHWQTAYPIEFMSSAAYERLKEVGQSTSNKKVAQNFEVILRVFEAFLAVTGQRLMFDGKAFFPASVLVDFVGAIYSEKFMFSSPQKRYKWAYRWRSVLAGACPAAYARIPKPHSTTPPLWFVRARTRFDALSLSSTQVDLWHGWAFVNAGNDVRWYDFRKLYIRYGKAFADWYAASCSRFYRGRKAADLPLAQEFSDYMASLPETWVSQSFLSPTRMSELVSGFLLRQAVEFGERGVQYTTFRDRWVDFRYFIKTYLCNGRVFAKNVEFIDLPTKKIDDSVTHIRVNSKGEKLVVKLLTDVPLHLSHKAATELIFKNIRDDVEAVRRWAQHRVDEIWMCYQRRKQLATEGTIKRVFSPQLVTGRSKLLDRRTANWQANCCATFEYHGFRPSRDGHLRSLYPSPLLDIARSVLGLPTKGALIPHMALLVINHPELTDGFFEDLALYDKDGQISGVSPTDIGWVLDGNKFRRGPDDAQQVVHLTDEGAKIVAQIVELTRPLRQYLKDIGDPNWRHLFLHCGKGFSYPLPTVPSEETSIRSWDTRLVRSFTESGQVALADAERLASRLSLRTLRKSVAVCRYLTEPNVKKLSQLLGHKRLEMRLLKRYLPEALLAFFQERWIRLFQCGLLLEALKDSRYMLTAVSFSSLDEATEFLAEHALKWNTRRENSGADQPTNLGHLEDRVVFSASVENLTLLESLRVSAEAVGEERLSALGRLWRDMALKIFSYIEHSQPPREDFREMLSAARALASTDLIRPELLYA